MRQLVDVDPELRRAASRAIKHAVIGSWARKALFVEVGVVTALLESLQKDPDKVRSISSHPRTTHSRTLPRCTGVVR